MSDAVIPFDLSNRDDENYASAVMKRAVARSCLALGFKHSQASAVDSLADIVRLYIQTLAVASQNQAEMSSRAFAGIQDVMAAAESTRPKSTNWKELQSFAFIDVKKPEIKDKSKWNQPFPVDIPSFPIDQQFLQPFTEIEASLDDASSTRDHVPSHLPPFPPAHTYKRSTSTGSKKRPLVAPSSQSAKSKRVTDITSTQKSLSIIENSVDGNSSLG
jgi:hypothetical protein